MGERFWSVHRTQMLLKTPMTWSSHTLTPYRFCRPACHSSTAAQLAKLGTTTTKEARELLQPTITKAIQKRTAYVASLSRQYKKYTIQSQYKLTNTINIHQQLLYKNIMVMIQLGSASIRCSCLSWMCAWCSRYYYLLLFAHWSSCFPLYTQLQHSQFYVGFWSHDRRLYVSIRRLAWARRGQAAGLRPATGEVRCVSYCGVAEFK